MFGDRRERLETEVDIGGERIALTIARQPRARRIILRLERGRRASGWRRGCASPSPGATG